MTYHLSSLSLLFRLKTFCFFGFVSLCTLGFLTKYIVVSFLGNLLLVHIVVSPNMRLSSTLSIVAIESYLFFFPYLIDAN